MSIFTKTREWLTADRWYPNHLFSNSRREPCRWHEATRASLEGAVAIACEGRGTEPKRQAYDKAIDKLEVLAGQPLINITDYNEAIQLLEKANG